MLTILAWMVFLFSCVPMAFTVFALFLWLFTNELNAGTFRLWGIDGMMFIVGPAIFFLSGTYLFGL